MAIASQLRKLASARCLLWVGIFLVLSFVWVRSYYYRTNLRAFSSYGFHLYTWNEGGGFSLVLFKSDPNTSLRELKHTKLEEVPLNLAPFPPAIQFTVNWSGISPLSSPSGSCSSWR